MVNKDFKIPLKPEFGLKHKRRNPASKKHRRPLKHNKDIPNYVPTHFNITDAPNTITESLVENNLARPTVTSPRNAASDRIDVLPTPVEPVDRKKKKKLFYKSQIKWLDSSINKKDITSVATEITFHGNENGNKDIAEERTIDIEIPEETDYNLDYSGDSVKEVATEQEIMNYSDEDIKDKAKEISDNIRVVFDPPSSPALSHIPIFLELPTEECPKFCIQVNVKITRMGKQVGTRCKSSIICKKSRRRR